MSLLSFIIKVVPVLISLGLFGAMRCVYVVDEGYVGIIYRFGKLSTSVRDPGLTFVEPWASMKQVVWSHLTHNARMLLGPPSTHATLTLLWPPLTPLTHAWSTLHTLDPRRTHLIMAAQVEIRIQTDYVTDVQCGSRDGITAVFDKIVRMPLYMDGIQMILVCPVAALVRNSGASLAKQPCGFSGPLLEFQWVVGFREDLPTTPTRNQQSIPPPTLV